MTQIVKKSRQLKLSSERKKCEMSGKRNLLIYIFFLMLDAGKITVQWMNISRCSLSQPFSLMNFILPLFYVNYSSKIFLSKRGSESCCIKTFSLIFPPYKFNFHSVLFFLSYCSEEEKQNANIFYFIFVICTKRAKSFSFGFLCQQDKVSKKWLLWIIIIGIFSD